MTTKKTVWLEKILMGTGHVGKNGLEQSINVLLNIEVWYGTANVFSVLDNAIKMIDDQIIHNIFESVHYAAMNFILEQEGGIKDLETFDDDTYEDVFGDNKTSFEPKDLKRLGLSQEVKQALLAKFNQLILEPIPQVFDLNTLSTVLINHYTSGYISKGCIRDLMESVLKDMNAYKRIIQRRIKNGTIVLRRNRINDEEIDDQTKELLIKKLDELLTKSLQGKRHELVTIYSHILDEIQYM